VTLVVEEAYPSGVPQTAVPGWAPTGAAWHWTAGSPGRAGWDGTVRHLIASRYTVNASYHGGLWHEHAADGRCRTVLQWIVPTSRAAHSIAPSQVFQVNTTKDRATQDARFREVRRILGARATDPNAGCIAIAYAGMPADLERDLACPVFRADVQALARQLVAHPTVIDRPHFGHGWIQPISRYEMDVTTDFIGLLYGAPPPQEDDMLPTRRKAEVWLALTDLPVHQAPNDAAPVIATITKDATFPSIQEQAELRDGKWVTVGPWRTVVLSDDRTGYFRRTASNSQPVAEGAAAFDRLNRGTLYEVDTAAVPPWPLPVQPDCDAEVAQAEQETTARVNQEWREWLATAPAAAAPR
jgi:hypothetical protein